MYRRLTVRAKLNLSFTIIVSLCAAGMLILYMGLFENQYGEAVERNHESVLLSMAESFEAGMLDPAPGFAREIFSNYIQYNDIISLARESGWPNPIRVWAAYSQLSSNISCSSRRCSSAET